MKSIRTKITLCLILTVLAGQAASGFASIIPSYNSTMDTVEQMMCQTAVLAADRVEEELLAYKNAVMDAGCIPQLSDEAVSVDEKQKILDERVSMHDFQRGNIIGKNGISMFDGKDYSDREYVQQAMQGNVYVSEPLISKITGELSIMVAAPIYTDGVYGSSIAGVNHGDMFQVSSLMWLLPTTSNLDAQLPLPSLQSSTAQHLLYPG